MPNPIPAFDPNLVLPPHLGDPTRPDHMSPYPCTTLDLCVRFGTTLERREILSKFLDFRDRLRGQGLANGFQWLDGSFLEDVEARDGRPPRDLDVVTFYWGYDLAFQRALVAAMPEFADPRLSKARYSLDHYAVDAGHEPAATVEYSRYWVLLFSHNRLGVWKGILKVELNTPTEDLDARQHLSSLLNP